MRVNFFHKILFWLFILFFGCAFVKTPGAWAQESVFTIRNVKVDITAANAVAAREQAFAQAQQDAFRLLAERLLSEDELARFQLPPSEAISLLVNDFEITDERLSPVRYVAAYTFRFKGNDVKNWFGTQGLSYTDVGSKPVLILPFYQNAPQSTVLWGSDNPWMAAWARNETWQGLVPATVPMGDLQDTADIGDNEALSFSPEKILSMTERYGAGEAVIMVATPLWSAGAPLPDQGPDEISIMIYRTDQNAPQLAHSFSVKLEGGENTEDLYDRAVRQARSLLQSDWKGRTVTGADENNRLQVRVRFVSMQEWLETQKNLRAVQGINELKLVSLKPGEARVDLGFRGSEERLRLALAQADMTLTTPQVVFTNPGQGPLVYDLYLNKYRKIPGAY